MNKVNKNELPTHDYSIKMIEGKLKKMKSVEDKRKYIISENCVRVNPKIGCFGISNIIDLKNSELNPKEFQKIVDDYCVKFNWNYLGKILYEPVKLSDDVFLTREQLINDVMKIDFSMEEWLYDFEYYMKFFTEHKMITHFITSLIKERGNELTDELEEFSKIGKKGELMEWLDFQWKENSSRYIDNGVEKRRTDKEVQKLYNNHLKQITTGWRTTQKYDIHNSLKEVIHKITLNEKVENYLGEVK